MSEEKETNFVKWDAVSIEAESLLLPDAMREPFIWLKSFTREECNRDLSVLVAKFKVVGVDHDRSTWLKIFKGRWKRNANGVALDSPVISQEKFLAAAQALRENVRVEALRGKVPFIRTSTWTSISQYIDKRRRPEWVNRFGIIIGPTGGQKTACFKEYCRLNNHGTCVWLEAPENGSLREFTTMLAMLYGVSPNRSWNEKRNKIFSSLNERKTIIVDNSQELYREKHGPNQTAFSFLRRISDETGCTVIMSITPTFERELVKDMMLGYFEQFEGRSGGRKSWLRLPEYTPEDDLVLIAEKLGLQKAAKHSKQLQAIGREPGRIRTYFEVLQNAKLAAEADGQPFTWDYIEEEIQ